METTATILHADLDAFYASVEQLLDPSLRGKPIAVGGGVVLAASYEAKAFGVASGMSGFRARELCPQLIFVGGHFGDYQRLGDAAIAVLNDFTPLVERISIDEAFADVAGCTHLFGSPADIAAHDPPPGAERTWPADLDRRRAHQAPGQNRLASRQARRARGRRSRHRACLPARPAGRADVGRRPGHQGAARGDRRAHHRAARQHAGLVARAAARSGGVGEAHRARLESRSAPNQDAAARAIGRRAVGARPQAGGGAGHRPDLAPSRRPGREPAARQIPARPDGDGARPLRRPSLDHPLDHARCADRGDGDARRNRRGVGAQGACASPRREDHLAACDLGVASRRRASTCNSNCRLRLPTTSAGPAPNEAWRAGWPTAPSTPSAIASAGRRSATARSRWEASRSVPDAFRELAEKDL